MYSLSDDTIADPLRHLFSQNRGFDPPNMDGALRPNCISAMFAINRLKTLANASIAEYFFLS